jgi:hypothetical protein
MAVETQLPQTGREGAHAKNTNATDNSLREFRRCALALREVLYQDRPLNEMEFLYIDNQFQVLEMAYHRWKRKHSHT